MRVTNDSTIWRGCLSLCTEEVEHTIWREPGIFIIERVSSELFQNLEEFHGGFSDGGGYNLDWLMKAIYEGQDLVALAASQAYLVTAE